MRVCDSQVGMFVLLCVLWFLVCFRFCVVLEWYVFGFAWFWTGMSWFFFRAVLWCLVVWCGLLLCMLELFCCVFAGVLESGIWIDVVAVACGIEWYVLVLCVMLSV